MEDRKGQENFQLIVITHDERFAQLIGQRQHAERYYRVAKDDQYGFLILLCCLMLLGLTCFSFPFVIIFYLLVISIIETNFSCSLFSQHSIIEAQEIFD
jgi:hypothetical protein